MGADLAVFPELWNIGSTRCPLTAAGRESWTASAIGRRSDFFLSFAALARELRMSIALTYLEAHSPKPRNSVSIINPTGEAVLNYSKATNALVLISSNLKSSTKQFGWGRGRRNPLPACVQRLYRQRNCGGLNSHNGLVNRC
jgi:hypothetical protein